MILKKIRLQNIRSYIDQEIVFPTGSVLLSGDIGCGKTSVLLGIEFALFGLQPGQKGASLLRNGEKDGSVTLEFEIDDKSILIERSLKRGKSVSQEEAYITVENERKELSVTELKNLILNILSYPQEFSKKTNILYRFTVYTPQEEMKQIILEAPEARLDTLRHVFGIDKYKRIKENAEIVRLRLREETKSLQGSILDLEEKKSKKVNKLAEIDKLNSSLSELGKEFLASQEKKILAESAVKEVETKIEEKRKLENEVDKTRAMLSGKNEMISSLNREEQRLNLQIEESKKITFNESDLVLLEKEREDLKKISEPLNSQYLEISGQISSLNLKNLDSEKLKNNISKIELCPTCLQDVNPNHKANIINRFDTDLCANKKRILELTEEKNKILNNITDSKKRLNELDSKISEIKLLKVKIEGFKERVIRLEEITKQKLALEGDTEMLNKHIEGLKIVIFDLSKYDSIYKSKESELETARRNEKLAEIKLAGVRKELEMTLKEISELEKEIERKEEMKKRLTYLLTLQDWISTSFMEIVSFTEKNVMLKLRDEFSKLFNEWFNILVPEIFTVRLDDSFTPVIEQQEFELDYNFLSGGERTAIALAYRLALNQTINSLLSKIKTKDIVILDEPTDGFSEQQLDKMRDVLSQLKVKQLILVSHEAKIESFVENIIKFKKEAGVTKSES